MDFKRELKKLKAAIDRELEYQFDKMISEVIKEDLLLADALVQAKKIALAGGKRIRGALLCWAYFAVGGKEKQKIIKAAAAIELVHLFLLVHDDIIDRGPSRHGKKTLHMFCAKEKVAPKDSDHLGNSMGIIAGDMLYVMANKIITQSGFDEKVLMEALANLQSVVARTIIGQSQDIAIAYRRKVSEKQVLAMYENKTARYTIEGPLHVGARLAGCNDKKVLKSFSRYAIPLGIGFQVRDDILGVFGDDKKTGKSSISDIEEGKQSILVIKAGEKANAKQRKRMDEILGKKNLKSGEIKEFRNILVETGALDFAGNLVLEKIDEGKDAIRKAVILPEARKFFLGLAEYLEKREF